MEKEKKEKMVKQIKNRLTKLQSEDAKILAKIPEPDRAKFEQRIDYLDKELEKITNKLERE